MHIKPPKDAQIDSNRHKHIQ